MNGRKSTTTFGGPFTYTALAAVPLLAVLIVAIVVQPSAEPPWPTSTWDESGEPPRNLVEYLADRGDPEYLTVHSMLVEEEEIAKASRGRYAVQDRPIDLEPPIDWLQDPYSDRSWRFWFHSLVVLEPLLQGFEATGDPALLERALALALDWIEHNQRGTKGISRFAWYDMAVPARAAYMSYLLRATAVAGVLDHPEAVTLARAVEDHADWLADPETYTAGHNHGLYQDAGLFVVARQFPDHPRAEQWKRTAVDRFDETLRATVAVEEGMHLEHSPSYHVLIGSLLERFADLGLGDDLPALVERLRENAGWLVMPDSRFPQLGDTDLKEIGPGVQDRADKAEGLRLFPDTGYGVVKLPRSYLILAAGYHGRGHKHADELTVSLYDRDGRVLVDAGRWGYYYSDPERIYAVSSRAHNGVEFDGEELVWRGQDPYGGGLLGGGEDGGWYALAATNPLLEPRGIDHRRLVLYAPGRQLVLIDRTVVPEPMSVTRYLHLAPRLDASPDAGSGAPNRWRIRGVDGFEGWACDLSSSSVRIDLASGVREPEMQGFTFPANRVAEESPTLIFESEGGSQTWVSALDLTSDGGLCAGGLTLRVRWNGETVEIGRGGDRIGVEMETPEAPGASESHFKLLTPTNRSEEATDGRP